MFKRSSVDRAKTIVTKKALKRTKINASDDRIEETRKMSALIRYHFKINPDQLSDFEFAKLWNDLEFVLQYENKRMGFGDPENE